MASVEVAVLGPVAVRKDGKEVPARVLRSRQGLRLLTLLAVLRPDMADLGLVVDALWRDDPPENPHRHVAAIASRLRAELGAAVVAGAPGGYRLGPPSVVEVDLDRARHLVAEAEARHAAGEHVLAQTAAEAAATLLSREVATGQAEAGWLDDARRAPRRLLRRAPAAG